MTPYYDDLVKAIIRPPRNKYTIEDLGSDLSRRAHGVQNTVLHQEL